MENKNKTFAAGSPQEVIRLDFQKIFSRMLSYWWLFLLCFGIAIGSAKVYLRYATFEYSSRAILLIKDAGRSGDISTQDILSSSDALSGGKAMDNEIQILQSLTLMEKVVERLDLHVQYFRLGNFIETEIYKDSPFLLDSFQLVNQSDFGETFFLELDDYNSFLLKRNKDDPVIQYFYRVPFEN